MYFLLNIFIIYYIYIIFVCNFVLHVGNVMGRCVPPILALGRDAEKTGDPSVDVGAVAVEDVASITEVETPGFKQDGLDV